MRIIILLFIFVSTLSTHVWADKIHMKNGDIVEGEIVDQNPLLIKIKTDKRTRVIMQTEVDWIEEDVEPIEEDYEPVSLDSFDYQEKDLLEQLIDVTGVRANIEKTIEDVINRSPLDRRVEMRDLFDADEILDTVKPLYGTYYTKEEIKQLVEFYQTPLGKKLLEVTPKISQESLKATMHYFKQRINP